MYEWVLLSILDLLPREFVVEEKKNGGCKIKQKYSG